ncbi:MAG: DNA integrity scanning protein DisA nucleotide-binding domain protein [Vicinamibacterales bacterium]
MTVDGISRTFDNVFARVHGCRRDVLDALLELAVEIAREGREGRRIGTLFTLGNAEAVLAHSRGLILDPLQGHGPHATSIFDANLRGTVKELAQLDGAFIVTDDGTVCAAARYLDATAEGIQLPLGLGSRHLAAASMSGRFDLVAVVVSESAVVRVFHRGELIAEIIPELWLLRRHLPSLPSLATEEHTAGVAIFTAEPSNADDNH